MGSMFLSRATPYEGTPQFLALWSPLLRMMETPCRIQALWNRCFSQPSPPTSHLLFRDVSSLCLPSGSCSASGKGLTLFLAWFPHSGRSPFPWAICSAHGAMRLTEVLGTVLHIFFCALFIKVVFSVFIYSILGPFAFSLPFPESWGWGTPPGELC